MKYLNIMFFCCISIIAQAQEHDTLYRNCYEMLKDKWADDEEILKGVSFPSYHLYPGIRPISLRDRTVPEAEGIYKEKIESIFSDTTDKFCDLVLYRTKLINEQANVSIYLSENELVAIVKRLSGNKKIKKLYIIDESPKPYIPQNISLLQNLKVLQLAIPSSFTVPASIGKLNELVALSIYSDSEFKLPKELALCKNLRHVDISGYYEGSIEMDSFPAILCDLECSHIINHSIQYKFYPTKFTSAKICYEEYRVVDFSRSGYQEILKYLGNKGHLYFENLDSHSDLSMAAPRDEYYFSFAHGVKEADISAKLNYLVGKQPQSVKICFKRTNSMGRIVLPPIKAQRIYFEIDGLCDFYRLEDMIPRVGFTFTRNHDSATISTQLTLLAKCRFIESLELAIPNIIGKVDPDNDFKDKFVQMVCDIFAREQKHCAIKKIKFSSLTHKQRVLLATALPWMHIETEHGINN